MRERQLLQFETWYGAYYFQIDLAHCKRHSNDGEFLCLLTQLQVSAERGGINCTEQWVKLFWNSVRKSPVPRCKADQHHSCSVETPNLDITKFVPSDGTSVLSQLEYRR